MKTREVLALSKPMAASATVSATTPFAIHAPHCASAHFGSE
jgi:hypothetical protein